jgi:Cu(I)/Ag(I) efflux system membrane fusion protein
MHPTIVQDHPGECPICGMKLVKMGGGATPAKDRKIVLYRSPMDPKQTSPTPRKDQMGMDYVPVYEDEGGAGASTVEGLATIEIDPARQQLIGLKIAPVTRGKVSGSWRTFSKVAADEQRVRHINVKVPVFVEHVYVNFVGKPVRKGEALFSGYSPELLAAQAEYQVALSTQKTLSRVNREPAVRRQRVAQGLAPPARAARRGRARSRGWNRAASRCGRSPSARPSRASSRRKTSSTA